MGLLKDEPIIIESNELRLYTSICAKCRHSGESETESVHRLVCGKCGNDTFKHIRSHAMAELLLKRGKNELH